MKNLGNVLLLGDSYTTFAGHIPDGYAVYYSSSPDSVTDARLAEQTWWHQVISRTGSHLVLNSSWSGSTVCNTGYGACNATHSSFTTRLDELISNGFFEKNRIDTVLVLGGTNDSWADSPIGEMKWSDWSADDLFKFRPAICYLAYKLSRIDAHVLFIINSELKEEVTDGIKEACDHYGVEWMQLTAIDKISGHPGIAGMKKIADQVVAHLENN